MSKRRPYFWKCGERTVELGNRTLIMGILNVTPDSFSDGGQFFDPTNAVERGLEMIQQGADIIDIGGESTRPGADPVDSAEEMRRVIPVIEQLRAHSNVLISIDTTHATTARAAIHAGADIINDISALEADPDMAAVAAESHAGVVLMHKKGAPKTMQAAPNYADVVQEIKGYLKTRMDYAAESGIARNSLVIDPGIGFGKTTAHNVEILRELTTFGECGSPILMGASRKRFIGEVTGTENPADRVAGSLSAAVWAATKGVHILRVHDVYQTYCACKLVDTLLDGEI